MTTAYKPPYTEDKKGMAVQMDQLIDSNGVAVNVSDLTPQAGLVTVLTTTNQTVGGVKTFSSMPVLPRTTVAAAGSTNADATQMASGIVTVTGADGTKGVLLPVPVAGAVNIVKNNTAAVLKVYPGTGAAINALTATTGAISMASLTSAIFFGDSATQYFTLPLLPS